MPIRSCWTVQWTTPGRISFTAPASVAPPSASIPAYGSGGKLVSTPTGRRRSGACRRDQGGCLGEDRSQRTGRSASLDRRRVPREGNDRHPVFDPKGPTGRSPANHVRTLGSRVRPVRRASLITRDRERWLTVDRSLSSRAARPRPSRTSKSVFPGRGCPELSGPRKSPCSEARISRRRRPRRTRSGRARA